METLKSEKYLEEHIISGQFIYEFTESNVKQYAKLYHKEQMEAKIKELEGMVKENVGAIKEANKQQDYSSSLGFGHYGVGLSAAIKTLKA